jgi:hypothetical protein
MAGSFALFVPAIGLGYLSDDYGLIAAARAWDLGPVTPTLFRPVPLALWSVLLTVGGGPAAIHSLNVSGHGIVSILAGRLAAGWSLGRRHQLLVSLAVLLSPLATEPVAWSSGVFDVFAAALMLAAILASRRYTRASPVTVPDRARFWCLALLALFSKETAVALPILVVLDAWIMRRWRRELATDVLAFAVAAGLYLSLRLLDSNTAPLTISAYQVQRGVFDAVAALVIPWHIDFAGRYFVIAIVTPILLVTMFTIGVSRAASNPLPSRRLFASLLWCLAAVVPVLPGLAIAADLQNTRYLYVASIGWSVLVVQLVALVPHARLSTTAFAIILGVQAIAGRVHLVHWEDAAELRDKVLAAAVAAARQRACRSAAFEGAPDNVRGAYVFRNSLPDAVFIEYGIAAPPPAAAAECAFVWMDASNSFVPRAR